MTRVRDAGTNAIIADYLYDPAAAAAKECRRHQDQFLLRWLADYDGTTTALTGWHRPPPHRRLHEQRGLLQL